MWRHTPREVAQPGIGSSVSFHHPLHNSPCHSFPLHSPDINSRKLYGSTKSVTSFSCEPLSPGRVVTTKQYRYRSIPPAFFTMPEIAWALPGLEHGTTRFVEWQRLRNANDGAMPLILNVGFHLHDEIRQKKISITFCCHQHFPAFFSRMSGIGTLHYHDHQPTPVSSVSCHGCYHNMVSGIQPYFHSPDKRELISI